MAHYLIYWKPDTVVFNQLKPRMKHSASDQYHKLSVVEELPAGFTGQHLQAMRRLYDGPANLLERLWQSRNE